jgi:hypothetical protein
MKLNLIAGSDIWGRGAGKYCDSSNYFPISIAATVMIQEPVII